MNQHEKKNGRFLEFLSGKGFYIILILCIAAIGVSGYMLIFANQSKDDTFDETFLDQPVNNLDKVPLPNWSSPSPSARPQEQEIPVAAITVIPKPSVSPKVSPAPIPAVKPASPSSKTPVKTVYVWPVQGEAVSVFSAKDLVFNKTMSDWRVHLGIDIEVPLGSQVCAVAGGVVKDIYDDVFLGTTVVIEHENGITSHYSNLMKKPVVVRDQRIKSGQVIGGVGQTAEGERREVNHLHFAMQKNNKPINPASLLP